MIMAGLRRTGLLIMAALLGVILISGCRSPTDPGSGLPSITLDQLPPEARQTIRLIDAGGPFPYEEDGTVFANREGILPDEPRGYYHEYTVVTPGSPDRGARRIISGDHGRILYYTDDHYASFSRIRR